jgi:AcrR family transcriptional regulator
MERENTIKSRERQKESTRQLILETANTLFIKKGYKKTTMRDIAKKAGIATGTTFAHFPNKASLLAATLYSGVEEVLYKAYRTIPHNATLIEGSVYVTKKLYEHFYRTPELTQTWLKETLFMEGEWADRINEQFEKARVRFRDILKISIEMGLVLPETDCELVATNALSHLYFALFIGHRFNLSLNEQVDLFRNSMKALLFGYEINSNRGIPKKTWSSVYLEKIEK